jgi:hypothetical protein
MWAAEIQVPGSVVPRTGKGYRHQGHWPELIQAPAIPTRFDPAGDPVPALSLFGSELLGFDGVALP